MFTTMTSIQKSLPPVAYTKVCRRSFFLKWSDFGVKEYASQVHVSLKNLFGLFYSIDLNDKRREKYKLY